MEPDKDIKDKKRPSQHKFRHKFSVNIDDEEYKEIVKRSAYLNLSKAEYTRQLISAKFNTEPVIQIDKETSEKLADDLGQILAHLSELERLAAIDANNLNQVAKLFNSMKYHGDQFDDDMMFKIVRAFNRILKFDRDTLPKYEKMDDSFTKKWNNLYRGGGDNG